MKQQAGPSPLAKELFSFPFIKSVFIASNFVTLTKTLETEEWQDVIPTVKQFLKEYLENGGPVVNEEEVAKMKARSYQLRWRQTMMMWLNVLRNCLIIMYALL
jgi:hypothetical protein